MANFISEWTVDSSDLNVTLPLISSGYFNFDVNWGDTNSNVVTAFDDYNHSHDYGSAGTYTIEICGVCQGFNFRSLTEYASAAPKLDEITQWGDIEVLDARFAFYDCANLILPAIDSPLLSGYSTNLSPELTSEISWLSSDPYYIESIASMFGQCESITTAHGLLSLNLTQVNDAYGLFQGAKKLVQPLNAWDVSNITNMSYMFEGASSFNQPLDNWNVSSVIDMSYMFARATNFNQVLNAWDVSNVTNMSDMFENATNFNQALNAWDVSNVTNMSYMFANATNFNQALNAWDVSNVTNMSYMFANAISFNSSLNWSNTNNLTSTESMFFSAISFNDNALDNWNVNNVTNMANMFEYAVAFNQPLNSWNVNNVVDMSHMFDDATAFNQPLNSWNVSNVVDMSRMFADANTFNQVLSDWTFTDLASAIGMFNNIVLPSENYSSLLMSICSQQPNIQNDVIFDGGNSRYLLIAAPARSWLITNKSWTITDNGTTYIPPATALIQWNCPSNNPVAVETRGNPRHEADWEGTWDNLELNDYAWPVEFVEFPTGTSLSPYQPMTATQELTFNYETSGVRGIDPNTIYANITALEQRAVIQKFNWASTNFLIEPQMRIKADDFKALQTALTDLSGRLICTQYEAAICFDFEEGRCNTQRSGHIDCSTQNTVVQSVNYGCSRGGYG